MGSSLDVSKIEEFGGGNTNQRKNQTLLGLLVSTAARRHETEAWSIWVTGMGVIPETQSAQGKFTSETSKGQ